MIKKNKSLDILDSLNAMDYDRPLCDPIQFLEDDYYIGRAVKNLSSSWKAVFKDLFSPGSQVGTLILTGAIGCGKSTFAACCFARKLYELSCLKDPAAFHGLLPRSKIIFGIYNITLEKADDVTNMIEDYVRESPYFQEHSPLKDRPRYPLFMPVKRLEVSTGSLSTHALGDNVLGFILDEANFFKKVAQPDMVTEKTRAHQLFNEARTRQVSRFMRAGRIPGLNILISSRKYQSSFLDEFIVAVRKDPELQKSVKVVEFALWQTKNPDDFSGDFFEVLVGTEHYPSRVLEFEEVVPEGGDIVKVPKEYYEQFVTDPDLALRDIAGVSTAGSTAYFPVKAKIYDCVDKMRTHPFSRSVITVPLKSDTQIDEFFQERKLCRIESSSWTPLVHPEIERHIHIDLAYSKECIGFTMGHPYAMRDTRLGAFIDFMLRIKPPVADELKLDSVVDFVKMLRNVYHFKIKKVTFDDFQSRMAIQLLVQAGFEAEVLSIGLLHYTHLKNCFNERRINMYEYQPLLDEIETLQKDPAGDRPHHKQGELDDVCDSLAGVVSRCYNLPSSRVTKGNQKNRVQVSGTSRGPLVIAMNKDRGHEEYSN